MLLLLLLLGTLSKQPHISHRVCGGDGVLGTWTCGSVGAPSSSHHRSGHWDLQKGTASHSVAAALDCNRMTKMLQMHLRLWPTACPHRDESLWCSLECCDIDAINSNAIQEGP